MDVTDNYLSKDTVVQSLLLESTRQENSDEVTETYEKSFRRVQR